MRRGTLYMYFIICFAAFLSLFCQPSESSHTVNLSEGFREVHNRSVQSDSSFIGLKFVRKYGLLEGADDNNIFFRPNDIVVDSRGNTYISDMGNHRIQKFGPDGQFLLTIGGHGHGPAEFAHYVRCMDIIEDELIVNHTNIVIHRLSANGEDLGRFSVSFAPSFIRHLSSGELVTKHGINITGSNNNYTVDREESALVRIFSPEDGSLIRKFGEPHYPQSAKEAGEFNHLYLDVDGDDHIFVSYGYRNLIEKYSPEGKLLMAVTRPLQFDVSDTPEWIDIPSRKTSPLPGYNIVSKGIGIDNQGRVWIITPDREIMSHHDSAQNFPADESKYLFHVLDSDGILLKEIQVPVNWFDFSMRVFGERLFLIEAVSEMTVHEYRITG